MDSQMLHYCAGRRHDAESCYKYDSEGYAVLATAFLDDKKPRTWLLHCLKWIRMSRRIWRILPSEVYKTTSFLQPDSNDYIQHPVKIFVADTLRQGMGQINAPNHVQSMTFRNAT
jgi:hypothetical protein